MRCPSCGNENREGARFCDSCGTELTRARSRPPRPAGRREPLPADVPSEIAAGRYRPRSFLGQGGRKRVYLADDAATDREVAVALFDTEGVARRDPGPGAPRGRGDAQARRPPPRGLASSTPGRRTATPSSSASTCRAATSRACSPPRAAASRSRRAVEIAADVTRALEHAHARGIVHRDLKPANIWLDDDGHASIGDFGLATTEGRSRMSGGTLVGTVAYLPPEQALGEAAGPESDLYSLGALLYEMLTGQPPFLGDDAVSIISQHLHADPVPPSRHNPEVPEALDRVVLRLLAKRRERPLRERRRGARAAARGARGGAGRAARGAEGEPARQPRRRRLRRPRSRARADARGGG